MTPLFKEVRYAGKILVCDDSGFIFQYGDATYSMKLFNVLYYNKGERTACKLMGEASHIEIEMDLQASSLEVSEVYVFLDGSLLQATLIQQKQARMKLRNPEYKYFELMMDSVPQSVSNELHNDLPYRMYDRQRANHFFVIQIGVIGLLVLYQIIRKIIQKILKKYV